MIIGTGIDIVDIRRIESLLERYGQRFITRVFTNKEIMSCEARSGRASSYAKVFAVKEATIKAISNKEGIRWHDIEITHDEHGRPMITLTGTALKKTLEKDKNYKTHVTISDERRYATAMVVIES